MEFNIDLDAIRRQAIQEVEDNMSSIQEKIARVAAVREEALAITASAVSRDQLIEVWVNSAGTTIRLQLDRDVYREYEPEALAAEILHVTQAAARTAQERVAEKLALIRAEAASDATFSSPTAGPELADLSQMKVPSMSDPDSDERRKS
ncbi:YbaB/EbfC family nucleoid-associated protein [Williamsia sp. CHRR-6]|uniref:YbaB/EbfC family nucleoid-associated protein n=1 Tax=Williamsia sp. CHRR-6 TaxID=2835871 RepID=UPI001BD97EA2|nr:YbaB/EbfC family nucleoid-associated protein [Williamsia sp. CHRR-6]MBT0568570.1 YbaB/EbfC family nucleoid-associated protein [Williamsia sp. CHRR-6]